MSFRRMIGICFLILVLDLPLLNFPVKKLNFMIHRYIISMVSKKCLEELSIRFDKNVQYSMYNFFSSIVSLGHFLDDI